MEDDDLNGTNATQDVPPGVVPVHGGRRAFNVTDIMPIPCTRAPFAVWVDGWPYAGFHNREDATKAVIAWRVRWPAGKDRDMRIKER